VSRAGRPTNLSPYSAIAWGAALFVLCALIYKLIHNNGDGSVVEKSPFSGLNFTFTTNSDDATVASRILHTLMTHWYTVGWLGMRVGIYMYATNALRAQYGSNAEQVISGDKTAMDLYKERYGSSGFDQSLLSQILPALSPTLGVLSLFMGDNTAIKDDTDHTKRQTNDAKIAQICDKAFLVSRASIQDICGLCSALSSLSGYSATITTNIAQFRSFAFNIPGSFSAANWCFCMLVLICKALAFAWSMFTISDQQERAKSQVDFFVQFLGPQYKHGLGYMFGLNKDKTPVTI
jgi:hypothetical protein